jgi:hypothetical protein
MPLRAWTCPFLFVCLLETGCGAPPEKEMQEAQGAIDAAKTAGAEQYAREELAAAQAALARATEAVGAGDYRLALSHALDSRERAQESARMAADGVAAARVEADLALSALNQAISEAGATLRAARANRTAAQHVRAAERAIENGDRQVQEARAAIDEGEYSRAVTLATATTAELKSAARNLKAAAPQPRGRRPK